MVDWLWALYRSHLYPFLATAGAVSGGATITRSVRGLTASYIHVFPPQAAADTTSKYAIKISPKPREMKGNIMLVLPCALQTICNSYLLDQNRELCSHASRKVAKLMFSDYLQLSALLGMLALEQGHLSYPCPSCGHGACFSPLQLRQGCFGAATLFGLGPCAAAARQSGKPE